MIIDSLCQYYERLLEDSSSDVSRPGYSSAKVSYSLVLSVSGNLVDVYDLRIEGKNKLIGRDMVVPEQVKRTSGVMANFLCDNCTYMLGLSQKNKKEDKQRNQEAFNASGIRHREVLLGVKDDGAEAILNFLEKWDTNKAAAHSTIIKVIDEVTDGGNLVFRLEGKEGYIHNRPAIRKAWSNYLAEKNPGVVGQCLVTGKEAPIARLHPSIKGVVGSQSSGASLVSFNLDSFTSYGKNQSYNSPISEYTAFGYTTVLNYMLKREKHRIRVGDTTVIFWAERSSSGLEEDLLGALFFPKNDDRVGGYQQKRDPQTIILLHDIFKKIRGGEPVSENLMDLDTDANFYILGLAPNASRLSVRFWHVDQYGNFLEKISQHYKDMSIVKSFENDPDFVSISRILKEIAPLGDAKRIPPLLGGVLLRAILTGQPYPQILQSAVLLRIRADQTVNYVRAAVIKACLVRNMRYKNRNEVSISMALDEGNTNPAYRLGRLFALLEKAQADANPGLNATIKDRYFGAASATPASVFPILLRLSQHHISKAEYGRVTDRMIEGVLGDIDGFPAHLNLEGQGLFVLGYYQQRQALYKKNEKKEV